MSKYNNDDCLMTSISNGIEEYALNRECNINIPLQFVIRRHICEFISNVFIHHSSKIPFNDYDSFEHIHNLLERIVK